MGADRVNARPNALALLALCLLQAVTPSWLAANDSKDAKKLYQHAEQLLLKGENDAAISEYREAIALRPSEARYHAGLGSALDLKGNSMSALEEYRLAHQLDPKNGPFRLMYDGLAEEVESMRLARQMVPDTSLESAEGPRPYGAYSAIAPIPADRPDPDYTAEARHKGIHGTVILRIIVDATGKVSSVRLVKSIGFGLDEKAIEAVSKWRYKPATRSGKPVAVRMTVETSFRLH